MSFNDFPNPASLLWSVPEKELPQFLSGRLTQEVREGVANRLISDSILSDTFVPLKNGGLRTNPESSILSGHFEGMPIVPGVVIKRLAKGVLGSDPYSSTPLSWGRKLRWKTEFVSVVTTATDDIEFVLEEGKHVMKSKEKVLATFDFGEHEDPSDKKMGLSATNTKDVYFEAAASIPLENPEDFVLQKDPFRFVTAGGELRNQPENDHPRLLGGYFHVPEDFAFVDEIGNVPSEIVEESVAQIASMAYAKTRGLPPVRENGKPHPKAQVLTFKSSIAERGRGVLVRWDQLTVAIEVLEEEGRIVKFAYEAWNCGNASVLSGIIEGTAIPLKLLKRMAS